LVAKADVFLHNLAPGAVQRLGFGSDILLQRHPQLVVCTMSGYGSTGNYRDKRAYDLLVQSEAGLVSITGAPDQPAKAGIPVADIAAGMYALTNILGALMQRERFGGGAAFEVTMFEALVEWMGHPIHVADHTGQQPPRVGLSHPVIAPYDAFPTADGHEVVLGVQNDREWARLARDVLHDPALADDPDYATNVARVRNRDKVDALVAAAVASLSIDEAVAALDAAQIANAHLNDLADVIAHPQLAARDRWREVMTPVGMVRALRGPVEPTGEVPMHAVPDLGEHTDAILRELGYDDAQVAQLRDQSIVR
jgi:itaconate CoA-transferase